MGDRWSLPSHEHSSKKIQKKLASRSREYDCPLRNKEIHAGRTTTKKNWIIHEATGGLAFGLRGQFSAVWNANGPRNMPVSGNLRNVGFCVRVYNPSRLHKVLEKFPNYIM